MGILTLLSICIMAAIMYIIKYNNYNLEIEDVRVDVNGIKSGYLCVFPVSSHLSSQLIAALPSSLLSNQKESIRKCNRYYTNCCNKYIDGAWAYAIVDENGATCKLVINKQITILNSEDICIKAEDLIINERSKGSFSIKSKGSK
jgi:hypothetical protein